MNINKILSKFIIFISLFLASTGIIAESEAQVSHKAGFILKTKGLLCDYSILGIFVTPEEKLPLKVIDNKTKDKYVLHTQVGKTEQTHKDQWIWQAPKEPGFYPAYIHNHNTGGSMLLNIFVMVPYGAVKRKYLNKYIVGNYPSPRKIRGTLYDHPKGFIEVTRQNKEIKVSPHFTLEQFLCKQTSSYPKYLVLKENLILKLEKILDELNHQGLPYNSFHVMSGYRTPHYNRLLGNVAYSRHLWGDAADIYVDENPADGIMDDLNKDGKTNYKDSQILFNIIDELNFDYTQNSFTGGLGKYRSNKYHGPFVHVDTRGYKARW